MLSSYSQIEFRYSMDVIKKMTRRQANGWCFFWCKGIINAGVDTSEHVVTVTVKVI